MRHIPALWSDQAGKQKKAVQLYPNTHAHVFHRLPIYTAFHTTWKWRAPETETAESRWRITGAWQANLRNYCLCHQLLPSCLLQRLNDGDNIGLRQKLLRINFELRRFRCAWRPTNAMPAMSTIWPETETKMKREKKKNKTGQVDHWKWKNMKQVV